MVIQSAVQLLSVLACASFIPTLPLSQSNIVVSMPAGFSIPESLSTIWIVELGYDQSFCRIPFDLVEGAVYCSCCAVWQIVLLGFPPRTPVESVDLQVL